MNHPSQTVAGKDISNPFMGEAFPKSLLIQLTQQIAEILKNDLSNEGEPESLRSINNPRKEDKDDRVQRRFSTIFDIKQKTTLQEQMKCRGQLYRRRLKTNKDLARVKDSCILLFLDHFLIRFP